MYKNPREGRRSLSLSLFDLFVLVNEAMLHYAPPDSPLASGIRVHPRASRCIPRPGAHGRLAS